ncbi:hypothetical protein AB6A40_004888 [Gnathostoma spinigerum]|uniref:Glucosidase II subunit alpha n=1 Tax=Gnathostoma spinigerum TaxID=75299 RepID=A0ABD6EDU8_9BILA
MEVNRIVLILSYVLLVFSVDRQNFKTCEQSGFCKRQRHPTTKHEYEIEAASVKSNGTAITAYLVSKINTLRLTLVSLEDSTLRLVIDETEKALRPRFQPLYALKDAEHLRYSKFKDIEIGAESTSLSLEDREKVILYYKPFRIDIFHKDEMIMSVNSGSFLFFEHFRLKTPYKSSCTESLFERWKNWLCFSWCQPRKSSGDDGNEEEAKEGFWSESFKSHHDSKPYGSSSVGLDFSFIGYKFVFGLPEHSDSFALRSTKGLDPYRLYNLDVFEYEIGNQMALYGSVPFITAHNKERTLAVLWLNAAETWVDIASSTADKGVLASIVDKFKTSADVPQIDAHFMSESGLIDAFIMLGPSPKDIFRQNSALTGVYPLPPLFSLGYHQCRWNYNDEEDVKKVHDGFEEHDIPLDTIWLDIEHTDGKKYFTWDPKKFPTPKDMISGLTAKGRKMVTIIDPHIKKDDGFRIYKEAKDLGYFVKDKNGNDFEGHCWPGTSLYLDFVNPVVRDYWAGNFAFDKYDGSTEDVFVWNDMNEPSVFSGPEITMPKDARHFGDWEHRDIHNMYGLLHHSSTYKGLMARSDNKIRPFILTRSFFIGSQRTTAVWTGDNTADWSHLRATVPMLLSLSISGIPHVGADVGGFFKNPDDELLVRWYQVSFLQILVVAGKLSYSHL